MKNVLGRLLFFIFFALPTYLNAVELASHTLTANNITPYEKEPVLLTFVATQKDHENVMFFFLKAKESDAYKIELLNKDENELGYHNKETIFTFLLFPLKSGKVTINFNYTIKVASDKAVAQVYEGSRDNVKWIDTTDTHVNVKPLVIDVKKQEQNVNLIGDFKLSAKLEKKSVSQYESANITYYLQGTGYDDINLSIIQEIPNTKIFSDLIMHYNKATQNGYKIQREFKYALLGQKDFTIPSITIKCFSPKTHQYYTIKSKSYDIKVAQANVSTLIDKEDFPKQEEEFVNIEKYFVYIIIFMSGFLTAKFLPNSMNFLKKNSHYKDIKESTSAKDLLNIMSQKYNQKIFEDEISQLEVAVYSKTKVNFKKIKNSILKKLGNTHV